MSQSQQSSNRTPAAKNATSDGKKRKTPAVQDELEQPRKKAKMSASIPSPPPTQRDKSKPAKAGSQPRLEIPETCPNYGCGDALPDGDLSAKLEGLFNKNQKLLSTPNHSVRRREEIEQDICAHISHENEVIRLDNLQQARGWPRSFNYASLVKRARALKAELSDLIGDDCDLYNCIAWTDFLEVIEYNIHAFGRCEDPESEYEYAVLWARCGYLGPQGAPIIGSTIRRIFASSMAELESALSATVQRLVDDRPQDFDSASCFNRPKIPYNDAIDIKDDNAAYGDMFYWDVNCPQEHDASDSKVFRYGQSLTASR
ncbi:hypothetical protein B0H13DRAFT_1887357 [Mycena leptocephala]|nr:hypothetical protein B0H13DRAFT_1887357 [Mycena leptocephala]